MAMWHATEVCRKLGVQNIILEGDAMEVVQALHRESTWRESYYMLVEEDKRNLHTIPRWSVQHVAKQANVTAHNLAKFVISIREEKMWIRDFPSCIHGIVLAEQSC